MLPKVLLLLMTIFWPFQEEVLPKFWFDRFREKRYPICCLTMFDCLRGKCRPIFCLVVWRGNAAQFSVWLFQGETQPNFLLDCLGAFCCLTVSGRSVAQFVVRLFMGWRLPYFLFGALRGKCCPIFCSMVSMPNFLFDGLKGKMLPISLFDCLRGKCSPIFVWWFAGEMLPFFCLTV